MKCPSAANEMIERVLAPDADFFTAKARFWTPSMFPLAKRYDIAYKPIPKRSTTFRFPFR